MTKIKQAMVPVESRYVRLLVAGAGAPVLLIHGSPNAADALLPVIERLCQDFLVIAPDTPGNGASDPLPDRTASAAAYADALAALLQVLKLPRVGVYGFHTGAVFAAELARRHPDRIAALVCEGYPLWTEAEAAQFGEGYLRPLVPQEDGSHLAALWSRIIDQNWFFPWHRQDQPRSVDQDLNDLDRLHDQAMGFLNAGDAYRAPYAPALKPDGTRRLAELTAPTLLTCAAADVLSPHLDRVPEWRWLRSEPAADQVHVLQKVAHWLGRHAADPNALVLPRSKRQFIDLPQGQLYLEGGADDATIWLHDAGQSSAQAPNDRDALRLDLPGHGLSTIGWPEKISDLRETLQQGLALAGLDLSVCRIEGAGLGRQLAALLKGDSNTLRRLPMEIPEVSPRWDGAHLLAAWHFSRFRSQYEPWFQRGAGARLNVALPTATELQQKTLDILRAGQQTLARTLPFSFRLRSP